MQYLQQRAQFNQQETQELQNEIIIQPVYCNRQIQSDREYNNSQNNHQSQKQFEVKRVPEQEFIQQKLLDYVLNQVYTLIQQKDQQIGNLNFNQENMMKEIQYLTYTNQNLQQQYEQLNGQVKQYNQLQKAQQELEDNVKKIKIDMEILNFKINQLDNKVETIQEVVGEMIQNYFEQKKNKMEIQNENESKIQEDIITNFNVQRQECIQQIEKNNKNKLNYKQFQGNLNQQSQVNSSGHFPMFQKLSNPSNQCDFIHQNSEIVDQNMTNDQNYNFKCDIEQIRCQKVQEIFNQLNLTQGDIYGEFSCQFGQELNYTISDKKSQNTQNLILFREVQVKGNCFYTAFGFQLINIISDYDDNQFQKFIQKISNIKIQINIKNQEYDNQEFHTLILQEFLHRLNLIRSTINKKDRISWLINLYTTQIEQDSQQFDGCFYGLSSIFLRSLVYHVVDINQVNEPNQKAKQSFLQFENEFTLDKNVLQQLALFLDIRIKMILFEDGNFQSYSLNENCEDILILYIITENRKRKINIVTHLQ